MRRHLTRAAIAASVPALFLVGACENDEAPDQSGDSSSSVGSDEGPDGVVDTLSAYFKALGHQDADKACQYVAEDHSKCVDQLESDMETVEVHKEADVYLDLVKEMDKSDIEISSDGQSATASSGTVWYLVRTDGRWLIGDEEDVTDSTESADDAATDAPDDVQESFGGAPDCADVVVEGKRITHDAIQNGCIADDGELFIFAGWGCEDGTTRYTYDDYGLWGLEGERWQDGTFPGCSPV